jgi:hypothetical protein
MRTIERGSDEFEKLIRPLIVRRWETFPDGSGCSIERLHLPYPLQLPDGSRVYDIEHDSFAPSVGVAPYICHSDQVITAVTIRCPVLSQAKG